ncbi:MAG TPA: type II toxin-antitoxin system RelE/ParE family toxin [Lachnospiraceae bacterium]|nr:type II toxin-antitoxin system RelE/ParE family toxin [Lachnospiraceae bacterium]
MESKFEYRLTQKADADLDGIVSYIAIELSNPKAASDFIDKLQKAIEEVLAFPESDSLAVNEYLPHVNVRKKLVGNYIMYYLPNYTEHEIFILRIAYGKRNMDEILRQLNDK